MSSCESFGHSRHEKAVHSLPSTRCWLFPSLSTAPCFGHLQVKGKFKVLNQFSGRFCVRFVATTMTTTGYASRRCKSTPWKDDENVTELYIFGRSWKIWSQIPMARSTPQPTSALVASAPSRNRSTQGSGRKSLKLAYPCKEQGYSTQCRSKLGK